MLDIHYHQLLHFEVLESSIGIKDKKGKYYYGFKILYIDSIFRTKPNLAQIGWCYDECQLSIMKE